MSLFARSLRLSPGIPHRTPFSLALLPPSSEIADPANRGARRGLQPFLRIRGVEIHGEAHAYCGVTGIRMRFGAELGTRGDG